MARTVRTGFPLWSDLLKRIAPTPKLLVLPWNVICAQAHLYGGVSGWDLPRRFTLRTLCPFLEHSPQTA